MKHGLLKLSLTLKYENMEWKYKDMEYGRMEI